MKRLFTLIPILFLAFIPLHSRRVGIPESYNPELDTISVITKDILSDYAKVPGKCLLINAAGDTLLTMYYNRDGQPLAKFSAISPSTGRWQKYFFGPDGTYYEEYRPPRRKKEGEDYMKYGLFPAKKKLDLITPLKNEIIYHNDKECLDKQGNWTYGWIESGDGKELIIRHLEYHGSTLSKKEYQGVVDWGENLMGTVAELTPENAGLENPFGVELAPVMAKVSKWLLFFLLAFGALSVFFPSRIHDLFDDLADACITPSGYFGKELLVGIIPGLLIIAPYFLFAKNFGEQEAFYTLLFYLGSVLVSILTILLSCRKFVFLFRETFWKQVFATLTVAAAISLVIPAIILFILAAGGDTSASASSSSSSDSSQSNSNDKKNPWIDCYHGVEMQQLSDNWYVGDDGNNYQRGPDGTYHKMG